MNSQFEEVCVQINRRLNGCSPTHSCPIPLIRSTSAQAELCELLTKHRGHLDDGLYVHSFDRGDRLPVKKSFGPLCMAAINCMWQLIHSREQCYLVRWYREA